MKFFISLNAVAMGLICGGSLGTIAIWIGCIGLILWCVEQIVGGRAKAKRDAKRFEKQMAELKK